MNEPHAFADVVTDVAEHVRDCGVEADCLPGPEVEDLHSDGDLEGARQLTMTTRAQLAQ